MFTAPDDAVSRPAMMRSSVVLPQPDGPSSTQNSPSATSKEISLRIALAPNVFETLSTVSEAMAPSVVQPTRCSPFHCARRETLHDAALKDQRQRHQRQSRDRRGRGNLAPRH